MAVYLQREKVAEGVGKSKKIAEQDAAMNALKILGLSSGEEMKM